MSERAGHSCILDVYKCADFASITEIFDFKSSLDVSVLSVQALLLVEDTLRLHCVL